MAKAPTKGDAAKDKGGDAKASGRGNALQQPVKPSDDLAEIVGADPLPRSEVVSKTWEYIKKHNLQDEKDKRTINADAKLEKIFGKKSATMFEMNKHISAHLTKI